MAANKTMPIERKTNQIIVVAQAGWVFIGEADEASARDGITKLVNAGVIRTWGTERGLGQICLEGAQKETIIDPVGVVIVPGDPVAVMECYIPVQVF